MVTIDNQKSKKIKCYGISNSFHNDNRKLFFNEYDDWKISEVIDEQITLKNIFDLDLYMLQSSPNHFHLLSFDILELSELKTIINNCTNDGDYLYNFYDKNFEYVLRLSDKEGFIPCLMHHFFSENDTRKASLQHIKIYKLLLGQVFIFPTNKVFENLETKIVVYQTNRRIK
jgi:hypothetical protein